MPVDPPALALTPAVVPFSFGDAASIDSAVDRLLASLGGDRVTLLGLGEPTHGIEEPLALRNVFSAGS